MKQLKIKEMPFPSLQFRRSVFVLSYIQLQITYFASTDW